MFTHEEIHSLNELEMSVYDYVMKNRQKVAYMKIRELADEAHVSTTTVLRFCKKLGCEGYSEFKIRYRMYLQQEISQKTIPDMDTSVLADYLKRMDTSAYQEELDRAVQLLQAAANIYFLGVGTSGILGKFGARYFSDVGHFSLCIEDPFTPVYQGSSRETAVVALSVSGETRETIQLAGRLKSRGCALLSITNTPNCTLARMSDCNIAYYMPETRITGHVDITSSVPVICIIEYLGKKLYHT